MIKHEDEKSLLMLHATLQIERSKPTFPIVRHSIYCPKPSMKVIDRTKAVTQHFVFKSF